MQKKSKYLTPKEADQLHKKLIFKYGAEMEELQKLAENDKLVYGFIRPETDIKRDQLIEKIKRENNVS